MRRLTVLGAAALVMMVTVADTASAQYYRYPPRGYGTPPCSAVSPGPFRGAARGAAGGALLGAIGGNAGRGAAIGAGIGGVAGIVRHSSARASGACY